MEVTSAKYQSFDGENVCITAVINGKTYLVPLNTDNTHYQSIQEWVSAGNTIEEAD
tara:strand:+ start:364 stop:531 length:168 start_codon:yes stop_codon:yes gene_type:complete